MQVAFNAGSWSGMSSLCSFFPHWATKCFFSQFLCLPTRKKETFWCQLPLTKDNIWGPRSALYSMFSMVSCRPWGRGNGKPSSGGTGGTGAGIPKPPVPGVQGSDKGRGKGKGAVGKKQCRGCWKMLPLGSFPPGKDLCWMDNRALDNIYKRAKASGELAWWAENRHDDKKRSTMLARYHELHPENKEESKAEAAASEGSSSKVKPGKGRQRGRGMFDIAKFKEAITTASELMMDRYCKDFTRQEFEQEKVSLAWVSHTMSREWEVTTGARRAKALKFLDHLTNVWLHFLCGFKGTYLSQVCDGVGNKDSAREGIF